MPCLRPWGRSRAGHSPTCPRSTTCYCPPRTRIAKPGSNTEIRCPADHPDRERAQKIIDSLPEQNPSRESGRRSISATGVNWPPGRVLASRKVLAAPWQARRWAGLQGPRKATSRGLRRWPYWRWWAASGTGPEGSSDTGTQSGSQAGLALIFFTPPALPYFLPKWTYPRVSLFLPKDHGYNGYGEINHCEQYKPKHNCLG
jgi:hypothetical protein